MMRVNFKSRKNFDEKSNEKMMTQFFLVVFREKKWKNRKKWHDNIFQEIFSSENENIALKRDKIIFFRGIFQEKLKKSH